MEHSVSWKQTLKQPLISPSLPFPPSHPLLSSHPSIDHFPSLSHSHGTNFNVQKIQYLQGHSKIAMSLLPPPCPLTGSLCSTRVEAWSTCTAPPVCARGPGLIWSPPPLLSRCVREIHSIIPPLSLPLFLPPSLPPSLPNYCSTRVLPS